MIEHKTTGKPRETVPEATSAGFEGSQSRARELRGNLPFDPHQFVVEKELAAKLDGITDVPLLNQLQSYDTRISAAAYYERRIKALTEGEEE